MVDDVSDGFQIDFPHGAGMLVVHAVNHADRARRDEIARNHPDLRMRHGGVWQALAKCGLDVEPDFAGGFFGAFERLRARGLGAAADLRSEETTSELQSLIGIS